MKRAGLLVLTLCMLTQAGGCAKPASVGSSGTSYSIYYSALGDENAESAVACETRLLREEEDQVSALMQALLSPPENQTLASPFPDGVRLLDWDLADGQLHLDLSEQFGGLTGVDLTVADACLALTFCQLEEVESVYVTVEGRELPYRAIQQLRTEDMSLYGGAEQPVSLGVNLWYPRSGEANLGVEYRQVTKTKDESLPQAVLSAWCEGPQHDSLAACMPQGSQVRAVTMADGVCTVDLSREFLDGMPADQTAGRLTIYALVNTLGELEPVDAVQLLIEGEPVASIAGVDTGEPIEPDRTLDPDLEPGTY
ncbi:GerMN domain-containing protein [Flavonifractor hominis]|uniref:GerMN domain-containing protein n=1 Tax=Flavonifractor hominis TaxID=3133178 RepID=A0ABV1EQI1_9FIRM